MTAKVAQELEERGLTMRELEIAAMVARGLSDRQIASELVVSIRTVQAHVHHIYLKIGVRSRVQLAVICAQITQETAAMDENDQGDKPSPRTIRITVDLTPELYRLLTSWVMSSAVEMDVPKLSMADSLRAMLRVVIADPAITARVHEKIKASR